MPRREHAGILGDLLDTLELASHSPFRVRLAEVASRTNLPHDRLVHYIEELHMRNLVADGRVPALTADGQIFLTCYRAWRDVQHRFEVGTPGGAFLIMEPIHPALRAEDVVSVALRRKP